MARIREALRRTEATCCRPQEAVPPPRPYKPAEREEEVPFIEVGGRETPMEASSSVLASAPPASRSSQSPESMPFGDLAIPVPPPKSRTVAFRPFLLGPRLVRSLSGQLAAELVALHEPHHPLSEQYRTLLRDLERQLPEGKPQTLLFMATGAQTDAAVVLLNLAITRARQGQAHDLVVDANLSRPVLAERLGLTATAGLGDVLAGKVPLPRAIQETAQANLYALPAGEGTPDSHHHLAAEPTRAVLHRLQGRFDWIFVNGPCWDGGPEGSALLSACNTAYLVVREADANTAETEGLSRLLVQRGGPLQGYFLV